MDSAADDLLLALEPLDRLLERAADAAQRASDAASVHDRFRGLYVGSEEVQRLLAQRPGQPPAWSEGVEPPPTLAIGNGSPLSRLSWLERALGLDAFEMSVLLLALAPDLDLRYERVFAFLQDDVTRRRPTVDLALNLLCQSAAAKQARLPYFDSGAPLLAQGVLTLVADAHSPQAPLLASALKVDEQIVRFIAGAISLDPRLTPFCELVLPAADLDEVPMDPRVRRSLRALLRAADGAPIRMSFVGADGLAKRRTAAAIAAERGAPLLVIDCGRPAALDAERLAPLAFRDAWLRDAVVFLDQFDTAGTDDRAGSSRAWIRTAGRQSVLTIFAGRRTWPSAETNETVGATGIVELSFDMPGHTERRTWWRQCLADHGLTLDSSAVDALADRFQLTASQIAEATATVRSLTILDRAPDDSSSLSACRPALADFFASARAQCALDLGPSARKITPGHAWGDIILPPDALRQLREVCARVTHRRIVLGDWGFDRKLSMGLGVTALFAGATGTGKTMAAEIVATELGLDLYKIDLAGIVSKYIGQTEKNLDRVFTAAEHANAILFFDEADALFGKRSEVRDSHDRYANIEISYLLQKMDHYEGIAILATNLRENMDDAFVRRLQFVIEFPFPDESHRQELWRALFPPETPRASAIDFEFLAKQFRLTGGHIKNIVLGASYLAASNGGRVEMKHLVRATWRECEKLGRALTPDDFGRYAENLHDAARS